MHLRIRGVQDRIYHISELTFYSRILCEFSVIIPHNQLSVFEAKIC